MSTQSLPTHPAWTYDPSPHTVPASGYQGATVVGHVTVTEPWEHTRSGSYAADFDTMIVEPGVYPVVATYRRSERADVNGRYPLTTDPAYYHVRLVGTIVSHYAWQGEKHGARIGQATSHTVTPYGYQAAELGAIFHGTLTVADGYEVRETISPAHNSILTV